MPALHFDTENIYPGRRGPSYPEPLEFETCLDPIEPDSILRDIPIKTDEPIRRENGDSWRTRILIADDDDDYRQLLAEALQAEGYEVVQAADGEELLSCVASQVPGADSASMIFDLIISDIRMPGPNGLWTLATLRHVDWATPFIVISGYADDLMHREARRLGAAVLLTKPLDLDEFRATVGSLAGPARADISVIGDPWVGADTDPIPGHQPQSRSCATRRARFPGGAHPKMGTRSRPGRKPRSVRPPTSTHQH